jgi:hypothetical protein
VILDATTDAVDAIEHLEKRTDLDLQPGFFLDLPTYSVDQCFAEFDTSARQGPLALAGLMTALDDQGFAVLDDDAADTDDGTIGILMRRRV